MSDSSPPNSPSLFSDSEDESQDLSSKEENGGSKDQVMAELFGDYDDDDEELFGKEEDNEKATKVTNYCVATLHPIIVLWGLE